MPQNPTKIRASADNKVTPNRTRRKATVKQARGRQDLARHGRGQHQNVKPMKFPGKLGGR